MGVVMMTSQEKRLANEFSLLYSRFRNASMNQDKTNENNCIINVYHEGNKYTITVNSSYPFKPPKKVEVNQMSVRETCKLNAAIFSEYVLEYYGSHCIGCSSILFNDSMWTPGYKIVDIIKEICNISQVKRKILLSILCNCIRNKYCCLKEFARFEDYLFLSSFAQF